MGNTLDTPVTEKETCTGKVANSLEGSELVFGVSSCQGWRINHEDTFTCEPCLCVQEKPLPGHSLFAVFDGHGGVFAADFARDNFYNIFCQQQALLEYSTRCMVGFPQKHKSRKKKDRRTKGNGESVFSMNGSTVVEDEDGSLRELLKSALRATFIEVDRQMLIKMNQTREEQQEEQQQATVSIGTDEEHGDKGQGYDLFDAGTAAVVVVFTPMYIICANAGDCRSILCKRRGTTYNSIDIVPLSSDHKPDNPEEERRIVNAGGSVSGGKVDGLLALSRALGDFSLKDQASVLDQSMLEMEGECANESRSLGLESNRTDGIAKFRPEKQKVSPVPDCVVIKRDLANDLFLIAACDGIWDVATNVECADMITQIFQDGEPDVGLVSEEVNEHLAIKSYEIYIRSSIFLMLVLLFVHSQLIDLCLKKGSRDNMTVLVVKFAQQIIGHGGGVLKRRTLRKATKAEKTIRHR